MRAKHKDGSQNNSPKNSSLLLKSRYEIICSLGSGGFGDTFLAEDIDLPSRQRCVVKMIRPSEQIDPKYAQNCFRKEASTLETLSKNCDGRIPELHAYFTIDNVYYLVQDYIEGLTLTSFLSVRQLQEFEVISLLTNLLQTLKHLHINQVVHRDIKPDNIIIRARDGFPVLIDFGAVKQLFAVDNTRKMTMVVGTPGFMPWEQASGQPTYASDIYALGVTTIFMLTGKIPQPDELSHWYKDTQVSPWLIQIINKAIAQELHERYSSAQEMLNDLRGQIAADSPTKPVKTNKHQIVKFQTEQLLKLMLSMAVILPVVLFVNAFKEVRVSKPNSVDMGVMKQDFLR